MAGIKRDPRLWAALSYALGLLSGALVLAYVKHDQYVRFHAMQSVLTFAAVAVVGVLLPTVPVVGEFRGIYGMFWLAVCFLWILLMVKAMTGELYRLPYIGDLAHTMSSK